MTGTWYLSGTEATPVALLDYPMVTLNQMAQ
jgi:hypothetical protein